MLSLEYFLSEAFWWWVTCRKDFLNCLSDFLFLSIFTVVIMLYGRSQRNPRLQLGLVFF